MPLSTLRFKQKFLAFDASSQRAILSGLSDAMQAAISAAGAASPPSDHAAFTIVRNLTVNMDARDFNSICCAGAFVWTQLLESDSPALAKALDGVMRQL